MKNFNLKLGLFLLCTIAATSQLCAMNLSEGDRKETAALNMSDAVAQQTDDTQLEQDVALIQDLYARGCGQYIGEYLTEWSLANSLNFHTGPLLCTDYICKDEGEDDHLITLGSDGKLAVWNPASTTPLFSLQLQARDDNNVEDQQLYPLDGTHLSIGKAAAIPSDDNDIHYVAYTVKECPYKPYYIVIDTSKHPWIVSQPRSPEINPELAFNVDNWMNNGQHNREITELGLYQGEIWTRSQQDKTYKRWNVSTGECQVTYPFSSRVSRKPTDNKHCEITPVHCKKRQIIIQQKDGNLQTIASGHSAPITAIEFLDTKLGAKSTMAHKFATSSRDHTVKIWDAKTGICTQTLSAHSKAITHLTALNHAHASDYLVSAAKDGIIKIWEYTHPFASFENKKTRQKKTKNMSEDNDTDASFDVDRLFPD